MTKNIYRSIRPGKIWLDTAGKPIHAHMPRLFYEDGVYYWYGLDKSKTCGDMKYWHWGVRYYRSSDLYNWEDLGSLIPPDLSSPRRSPVALEYAGPPSHSQKSGYGEICLLVRRLPQSACHGADSRFILRPLPRNPSLFQSARHAIRRF